jgi:hypothetical protein
VLKCNVWDFQKYVSIILAWEEEYDQVPRLQEE